MTYTRLLIIIIMLLTYWPVKSAAQSCNPDVPKDNVKIFYLNGTVATLSQLARTERVLDEVVLPKYNVRPSIIRSKGGLKRLIEVANNRGIKNFEDFTSAIVNPDRAAAKKVEPGGVETFAELRAEPLAKLWSELRRQQEDVQTHIENYLSVLDQGKGVVLLGYSQGSVYANFEYSILKDRRPKAIDRVGVVEVGAVPSSLPIDASSKRASHTTLKSDKVIQAARIVFGKSPLPGNFSYRSPNDVTNHSFKTYFEENTALRTTIREDVHRAVDAISDAACEGGGDGGSGGDDGREVVQCGGELTAQGGSEGLRRTWLMGNQNGSVKVQFEAFQIPDGLKITSPSGLTYYSTGGLASGFRETSFFFDFKKNNKVKTINVAVDGNQDEGTRWQLAMSCPGKPLDNEIARKDVRFNWETTNQTFQECRFDFFVDNQMVSFSSTNGGFTTQLTPGTHSFSYRNVQCDEFSRIEGPPAVKATYRVDLDEEFTITSPVFRPRRGELHIPQ